MKLKKIFAGMSALAIAATMSMAVSAADPASKEYNFILITTDIPCEVNDDDQAVVNDSVVTCKDLTLKIGDQSFDVTVAPQKTDEKYLCFEIINKWNTKLESQVSDYAVAGEGEYLEVTFTIEGLGDTSGNAGIAFQANDTWDFRNTNGSDTSDFAQPACFPNPIVGLSGGTGGYDTNVDVSDTAVNGDGTYTVSIAQSGTVNSDPQVFDDGTTNEGWKWAANAVAWTDEVNSSTDSSNSSSTSGTDSKTDSNSSKADTSSSKSGSTSSKSSGTSGSTSKSTSTAATSSTSSTASDNTNSATGATAGIALAGIALAGAALVVSKRK
ncbi:MAG: NPXTG-anchored protein [Ruminococcus sp.]|nr:NPXTG-anchored protein [Ruminococcus sp.]